NPTTDPANVVQALVYTILDVFDATRDLYQTLRKKEKRDHEQDLRARGYPSSRKIEYVDDYETGGDESIVVDKAAVTRQFEIGFQDVGSQFAVGDAVITQTALQSQIISLQSVVITTFLYGPTSPEPISHHLSSLVAASRAAGTGAVDVLAAQQQRQLGILAPTPRSTRSPAAVRASGAQLPPYPVTATGSASTTLVKSRHEPRSSDEDGHMRHTSFDRRPQLPRTDTESTAFSGPTSYGTSSAPHNLFCLYACDLQRHPSQPLSASITSDPSPYCPYCKRTIHLSPGKSWEIFKEDDGRERCFRIQNRFIVKCHRDGVDGGYTCVLCSNGASVDTICGDVKALVRHIWMDHGAGELELEEDIDEIAEQPVERRDSGLGLGSRRSASVGPSRGKARRGFEKEVETFEIRAPRRGA
ncbi:hypothetical protein BU26DRAFT_418084, partial [Trematosphaeria pertusa]